MEPLLPALLELHESKNPSRAFCAMADALKSRVALRGAFYVGEDRTVRDCWPTAVEITADLVHTSLHVLHAEVLPLGSEFPFDAANFPDADVLVLPFRDGDERRAACLLIGDSGVFGEELQPWERLARSLEAFEARNQRLNEAEARAAELQRRVEESEALHTLGLAANRTLDQEEVLNLVARFTRTLLGAHYVTVNTVADGLVHAVAAVGLRDADGMSDDYWLARAVVAAEKPVTLGGPAGSLRVDDFPFHRAEGMVAGLGIPLTLFGDTFGALIVGYRQEYAVSPRDIRLAVTLAGYVAVAIGNARLHEQVEQRSEELARAYEELSDLSRAKERFFASINHELRNPLNAVINYQKLLLSGFADTLPDSARGYLQKAHRAGETLATLVNDLLDLSKIAAGKMSINVRECALADILDGVANTLQPLADERSIALVLPPAETLPTLRTDSNRVQQILVNLISNALKFTAQGEVRVVVVAESAEGEAADAPGRIRIEVVDTGPGISPDDLKRIFEEYEQVQGTRGGTGLGLPISRRLSRLLGGELRAESEVGRGSRFILTLPLAATPSLQPALVVS